MKTRPGKGVISLGCILILTLTACGRPSEPSTAVTAGQSSEGGAPQLPSNSIPESPQGLVAGGLPAAKPSVDVPERRPVDPSSSVTPPWRVATEVARSTPDIGARMTPPVPGTVPRFSAAAAYARFVELGIRPGGRPTGHPDDLVLVVYSNDSYGQILPSGDVKPHFQNVLAWAIIFKNGTPTVRGPDRSDGSASPQLTKSYSCESVTFINATTNEYMNGYEECIPQ